MMRQCCDNSSLQLKHKHKLLHQERCPPRFLAGKSFSLILQGFVAKKSRETRQQREQAPGLQPRAQGKRFGAGRYVQRIWIHDHRWSLVVCSSVQKKTAFCMLPASSRKIKLHETMSVLSLPPKITDKMLVFDSSAGGSRGSRTACGGCFREEEWGVIWIDRNWETCETIKRKRDAQSPQGLFVNQL